MVVFGVFSDVFVDWKQNDTEVTVRLRCGDGVQRIEDISSSFSDTHCHVSFPGNSSSDMIRPSNICVQGWTSHSCTCVIFQMDASGAASCSRKSRLHAAESSTRRKEVFCTSSCTRRSPSTSGLL